MRGANTQYMKSRVGGRLSIEKSLHSLHRRIYRFATLRACSERDYSWALALASALQTFLKENIDMKEEDSDLARRL
jgi:hypothetical protein